MTSSLIQSIQAKFNKAIEIQLHPTIYFMCKNFAKKVNSTTCYDDCGQNDFSKREYDNLVGKIGEWGVYGACLKLGFAISKPDMLIYSSEDKNWNSDFVISDNNGNNVKLAVKSQDYRQAKRFGFSGTFQIDSQRKDKIFSNKNQNELVFLGMVIISPESNLSRVLILPPKLFSELKLTDPKMNKYKDTKKCYYAYDNFDNNYLNQCIDDFINDI